ncbi:MAG: hypothetical protein ACFHVJ_16195 [Aestuariibacter sp.]
MTEQNKHHLIIDWKLSQLQGRSEEPLRLDLEAYLQSNEELQAELQFIEAFWLTQAFPDKQPSENLRKDFYQMLASAEATNKKIAPQSASLISKFLAWLALNPGYQATALVLCFVLGFWSSDMHKTAIQTDSASNGIKQLQADVSSLSTMVAISMLQKPSASERLNGLVYSRETNLQDPQLVNVLVDMLSTDKSVSVRLAIIETLKASPGLFTDAHKFIDIILNETNPLVQMELCRLVANKGNQAMQQDVFEHLQTQSNALSDEVLQIVDELQAFTRA